MPLWRKAVAADHGFQLPDRIGAAMAKRRAIGAAPQPGAVGHDEQHPPARPQHPGAFGQQRVGLFAGLQPMQHHQLVDQPG